VRPAGDHAPDKFETGTQNHEGIAGTRAAVEYLASLAPPLHEGATRRERIVAGLGAIQGYERSLCERLLAGLAGVKGVHVLGLTDPARLDERVPTVSFTMDGRTPRELAEHLGARGIFTWNGHFYALALSLRLGLEPTGGMLRVGLAHYNTADEVDRLLEELATLSATRM
jgi:selenocysteine lyase/cysteine desulfurase